MRYSESLDTVIFQKSWSPLFMSLTDEEAGKLIKAVVSFMEGEDPELEGAQIVRAYLAITKQIERSAKKYYKKVQSYDEED